MILKPLTDTKWKGYTLDQLRENMAVTDARIMLQTEALKARFQKKKDDETTEHPDSQTGAITKILGLVDYVLLVVSIVRKVRRIFARLSRKKADA